MKNALISQTSEYDCGPTTLVNALRYLYARDELPPALLKAIYTYTLDCYDDMGVVGKAGTSCMAMRFLASWLDRYAQCKDFPIEASYLEADQVVIREDGRLMTALGQGGVVVIRCRLAGDAHYVLLTRAVGNEIGLFDPYQLDDEFFTAERIECEGIRVTDEYGVNRLVATSILNSTDKKVCYAMGEPEEREALILFNTRTKRTEQNAIEYVI